MIEKNITSVAGGIQVKNGWFTVFYNEKFDGDECLQHRMFDTKEGAWTFHKDLARIIRENEKNHERTT